MGGNGRKPLPLAPTQEHVPVEMVRNGLLVSRVIVPADKGVPHRVITRVLRVGAVEVTRMADSDRADFLDRYAAAVAKWRFPYQILVTRERQDLSVFYRRLRRRMGQADRRGREILDGLGKWMRRVTERVNPQVPAYYIALPHPVTSLEGPAYEKVIKVLDTRSRLIINTLGMLGIPAAPVEDEELMRLLYEMYHPRLPDLSRSPRARVLSLVAEVRAGGEPVGER